MTRADRDYVGSCGIDPDLMRVAEIIEGEQLHVVNVSNGSRAVTYAIAAGPGEVTLNGAMAHLGSPGDLVIVMTYGQYDEAELRGHVPRIVHVDAMNHIRQEAAVS
ncbi:MAG: aspartate 1-decarboxylase [Candidatus Dormibacteria bacterium]